MISSEGLDEEPETPKFEWFAGSAIAAKWWALLLCWNGTSVNMASSLSWHPIEGSEFFVSSSKAWRSCKFENPYPNLAISKVIYHSLVCFNMQKPRYIQIRSFLHWQARLSSERRENNRSGAVKLEDTFWCICIICILENSLHPVPDDSRGAQLYSLELRRSCRETHWKTRGPSVAWLDFCWLDTDSGRFQVAVLSDLDTLRLRPNWVLLRPNSPWLTNDVIDVYNYSSNSFLEGAMLQSFWNAWSPSSVAVHPKVNPSHGFFSPCPILEKNYWLWMGANKTWQPYYGYLWFASWFEIFWDYSYGIGWCFIIV